MDYNPCNSAGLSALLGLAPPPTTLPVMALKDRILEDMKKAMRDKDTVARDTLRMVRSELGNRSVELGRDLKEDEEVAVLKKAVKSRQETIAQYEEGGRGDAAENERREIEIIEQYLPKQLSEDETRAAVEAIKDELGLSGKKDMGALMKELKSRHGGAVDGKTASKIAQEVLGG